MRSSHLRKALLLFWAAAIAVFAHTRAASSQIITEFAIPTANSQPRGITSGPDGALWFTEFTGNKIGRITTDGSITEFSIPTPNSQPRGITAGPDGALWFTQLAGNKIGRITTAGVISEFSLPSPNAEPRGITTGPDGALWFAQAGNHRIGRISTSGAITESFQVLGPSEITTGPDGNLWFTAGVAGTGSNAGPPGKIGKITPDGAITEFLLPSMNTMFRIPAGITVGPDGALWFTIASGGNSSSTSIGRITTAGSITEFGVGAGGAQGITAGPDGRLWFPKSGGNCSCPGDDPGSIVRIAPTGTAVTVFPIPTPISVPSGITVGPDGALWFTEFSGNKIGRIETQPPLTLQVTPETNIAASGQEGGPFSPSTFNFALRATTGSVDYSISGVPSWLTASSTSGTVGTAGTTVSFTANAAANSLIAGTYGANIRFNTPSGGGATSRGATLVVGSVGSTSVVSAVLPSSRSVQGGTPATAFSTIINAGNTVGIHCGLALGTSIPATFSYQTTNPATNQVTGSPNSSVNILAGASQSYVFSITANSAFPATNVAITARCTNSSAASTIVGVNTLLLSASGAPVPDIVALAATASNDGILNIPGGSGSAAFAVATVNVGASAAITASADTGAASLPVSIALCRTDPNTAACLAPAGPTVTTTINANATPTFSIFVGGGGNVPFDPANNRIFVRFKDGNGETRGATSVALRTQ